MSVPTYGWDEMEGIMDRSTLIIALVLFLNFLGLMKIANELRRVALGLEHPRADQLELNRYVHYIQRAVTHAAGLNKTDEK